MAAKRKVKSELPPNQRLFIMVLSLGIIFLFIGINLLRLFYPVL